MRAESSVNQNALISDIHESFKNVEAKASRLRSFNTSLLITSIVTAAATTLVTAVTAASGPIIGQGVGGWKISCIIAAVLGFVTTVSVGTNQALGFTQRLSRINECAGRLKYLDVSIKTGRAGMEDIAKEYSEIVRDFAADVRG